MSQAIMDPEKVRRFAEELQRFNSEIENRMIMLHARFAALGDTWSDQEHEKFSEEFKQALKALRKFTEMSKEHTPFLLRKAQRIEEYLNQRVTWDRRTTMRIAAVKVFGLLDKWISG